MYTIVSVITRSFDRALGVQTLTNPGEYNVRALLSENDSVYLTLASDFHTETQTLLLHVVANRIYNKPANLTLSEWLLSVGSETLPTTSGRFRIEEHTVTKMDAHLSGYTTALSTGYSGTDDDSAAEEALVDLRLNHPTVPPGDMGRYVLATVGGYLHLTDSDPTAFYVRGGGTTAKISQTNRVGLISFSNVGELTQIPLRQATIVPTDGTQLKRGVTLTTEASLFGKTVWLVIGGHLLYMHRHFKIINDKSIFLDWGQLNIHLKYLVSRRFIDLSAVDAVLNLEGSEPSGVVLDDLNSDVGILAYLSLPQSFMVVIDDPTLSIETVRMEDTGRVGKYYTPDKPYSLYLSEDGRLPDPWLINERKTWVISTGIPAGSVDNWYGHGMRWTTTSFYPDATMPHRGHYGSALYRLDIRSSQVLNDLIDP